MLGFRFLATQMFALMGKDMDFMPKDSRRKYKRGGMSLDDTEGFFMALAEGQKRHGS